MDVVLAKLSQGDFTVQSQNALAKLDEVKQATMESNQEMVSMTEAMQRISSTSMEIANIVAEIEIGNQITARTANSLRKVVDALEEVREGAQVSTKLSEEQANAMHGIEEEIKQITDVVQNNSATAQESSAICEELSAQAMGLNGLVEEFSI